MIPASRSTLAALLLIGSIGVFYLATIREGHVWGDDHAAYIAHAKNIAEGRAYGAIGYVRSPSSINPQMYPPGFPLLLAPVYHYFGLDLTPMKVMNIGCFCVALWVLYYLLRPYGDRIALVTVGVIGACPYFWDFKDTVASEFPFLAFAYGSLLVERRAAGAGVSGRLGILLGVVAGVLCGLAYATRNVGIVLPIAICLSNLTVTRRITSFSIATVSGFAAIAAGQKLLFNLESDYLTPLLHILSVHALLASPWYYFKCLSVPWDNGHSHAAQWVLFAVLVGLVLRGSWLRCRQKWTSVEFFSVLYMAFIMLFPWGGRRYLIPVMPLFVLYALVGMRDLATRWPVPVALQDSPDIRLDMRSRHLLPCALILAVLATFILKYSMLPWRDIPGGVRTPGFGELTAYLSRQADGDGPVVMNKARLQALYSGIPVADGFEAERADQELDYYDGIGASRFIVQQDGDDPGNIRLMNFVTDHPANFVPEKQIGVFRILRFTR